ncbi:MAG TPA: D-alanyl-D-alanine carboxypeptidase/D-alanyl-D-alanine-endopeptidase [Rubellimicrobium sp.]|nr:D-alanyl-D-alanine carboxypeptidase/D-alanyl-D-alanine-endopeptidase [Rubellimicrobium sp.]
MARTGGITRRGLLAGGLSAVAGLAWAQGAPTALRPPPRPGATPVVTAPGAAPATRPQAREELDAIVRATGIDDRVSIALVDVDDGTILWAHEPLRDLPPASVAKSLTTLYALDALGPDHRFATRLLATAPVVGGRIDGELILAGGGDPVLSTDRLADLAVALAQAGVKEVGGFRVWGGALPQVREISPEQLPWLDYNPAISGLNLNFNRVYFEWQKAGADYRVRMEAVGDNHRPPVALSRMTVENRSLPVYTYEQDGDADQWTVARAQLGGSGSRWLPVRTPALYAGQAFVGLANEAGLVLPAPSVIEALPEGTLEVARIESEPLTDIIRGMLLHSTNLTAEVLGLSASLARGLTPRTPAESAAAMNDWLRRTTGARVHLVDHSGLGGTSRVAAQEMAMALAHRGTMDRLRPLLKDIVLTDASGEALDPPPALVRAKTGTLNFVSALAGYVRTTAGTDLAFAYFSADVEAREASMGGMDEIPAGSRDFLARSRRLQQELLQRWGLLTA